MLVFANASDNKLVNRPKSRFLLNFVGTRGVRGKILHSAQLDHSTNK